MIIMEFKNSDYPFLFFSCFFSVMKKAWHVFVCSKQLSHLFASRVLQTVDMCLLAEHDNFRRLLTSLIQRLKGHSDTFGFTE